MRGAVRIRIGLLTAITVAFGGLSQAEERGVRPPVQMQRKFPCPDVDKLPGSACCRVVVLIDEEGKTRAAKANCTLPEAVPLAVSCQLPLTYKPATKFGKPIPFLAETTMVFNTKTPKQVARTCGQLEKPSFGVEEAPH